MPNGLECFFKRHNIRKDLSSLPLKLKTAMFPNLPLTACFWATQHDTAVISLSLNCISVGWSEFNFSAAVFIQVKRVWRRSGFKLFKTRPSCQLGLRGALWIQNALLLVPFPVPCAFGLRVLHRGLCDLVLFLDWIIWLVSHPAQLLPVWLVVLWLGAAPGALFRLGHLYAPLGFGPISSTFPPCSVRVGRSRIPDLVIASFTMVLFPPWQKLPPEGYDKLLDPGWLGVLDRVLFISQTFRL